MSTNIVDAAIATYNREVEKAKTKGGHVEFEIRFDDFTSNTFLTLLEEANKRFGNGVYTTDVHISANDVTATSGGNDIKHIYEMTYVNNKRVSSAHMTKERVARPARVSDYINYRIGVAIEKNVQPFELTTNAVARHRNRMSYTFEHEGAAWRLDATAIVMLPIQSQGKLLQQVRNHTMGARRIEDSFLRDTIYEVELELVSLRGELTKDALAVTREIFGMLNPSYTDDIRYQKELYQIALAMNVNNPLAFKSPNMRLKQLAPQVIAINRSTFYDRVGTMEGFFLTLKLDGERAVVSAGDMRCVIMMSMNHMEFTNDRKDTSGDNAIVDAEIVFHAGTVGGAAGTFDLYVFDVIEINDDKLTSGIQERVAELPKACAIIGKFLPKGCKCIPKQYVRVENAEKDITAVWKSRAEMKKINVGVDGLIFSEPGKRYLDTVHYKWKPTSENTIDFVAKKCPASMLGRPPYIPREGETCYLLFVGIKHRVRQSFGLGLVEGYHTIFPDAGGEYYPVQFSPSYDPLAYVWYHTDDTLDGKIVELLLKKNERTGICDWVYHRTREDRKMGSSYYGNNFYTAETTYMNYIDEFPLEALWAPAESYFQKTADTRYRASNGYKRYVIAEHIEKHFKGSQFLIDAAAGRGGDLSRFRRADVRNLLALDTDATAINELIERGKYTVKTGGNSVYDRFKDINSMKYIDRGPIGGMFITVSKIDLSSPAADIEQRCMRYGFTRGNVDGIVCNFALHYFCDTEANLRNFLTFVHTMLAPKRYFMFTVMSGDAIVKILGASREWQTTEGDSVKYRIVKRFNGNRIEGFGQQIEIKLPFTDKMMREPLCNLARVNQIAGDIGLDKVVCTKFSAFFDNFSRVNNATYKSLTEDDKTYIDMHRIVVLKKK